MAQQTLTHTRTLAASAKDIWEACYNADKILCDLLPLYFTKVEYLHGHGEIGSIRYITTGPDIEHARFVKERLDKFDDATKTLGYTVLESDPRYSSFSAELQFVEIDPTLTEATWTATYVPVGDMGPPEHILEVVLMVLEALETAATMHTKQTFAHMEIFEGVTPDALWDTVKRAEEILLERMPNHFVSATNVIGNGGPSTIRSIVYGPEIEFAFSALERIDFIDNENKRMGYTILEGDPAYRYFTATTQLSDGPRDNSTAILWVANYVQNLAFGNVDDPPNHIRDLMVSVWKTLAAEAAK